MECLAHSRFSKIVAISTDWQGIMEPGNTEFIHQSNTYALILLYARQLVQMLWILRRLFCTKKVILWGGIDKYITDICKCCATRKWQKSELGLGGWGKTSQRTCYINHQDEQEFPSKEREGYLGQRIAKTWSHERAFTFKKSKKLERGRGTTAGPLDG